jgi:hypothetical protein
MRNACLAMLRCGAGAPAVAMLLGWLAAAIPDAARAEVNVSGTPASVRIVADHDAMAATLSALGAFNVRYRTSVPLDAVVSGTYAGSLKEVIARLLDGYAYVVRHEGEVTEIVVFARRGARPVAVQPSSPTKTFASEWR